DSEEEDDEITQKKAKGRSRTRRTSKSKKGSSSEEEKEEKPSAKRGSKRRKSKVVQDSKEKNEVKVEGEDEAKNGAASVAESDVSGEVGEMIKKEPGEETVGTVNGVAEMEQAQEMP